MEMIYRTECDACGNHWWLEAESASDAYRCPFCEATNRVKEKNKLSHFCECGTWDSVVEQFTSGQLTTYTGNFGEQPMVKTTSGYAVCPHCETKIEENTPKCPMCSKKPDGAYPHIFSCDSTSLCKECSIKTIQNAFKGKVLSRVEINETVHSDEKLSFSTGIEFDDDGNLLKASIDNVKVEKLLGMNIVIDPSCPPDTIKLVDKNGYVLAELTTNL